MLDPETRKQLEAWLETWADHVRRDDPEGARCLFAPSLHGFGTWVFEADGRDAVEREQWRYVWPRTRGFAFELEGLAGWRSDDGSQACVAVPWRSTGFAAGGASFERRGRATIVLARAGAGWLGQHTHFSVDPGSPHPPLAPAPDAGAARRGEDA